MRKRRFKPLRSLLSLNIRQILGMVRILTEPELNGFENNYSSYGFSSRPYSFPPFLHPLSRFLPFPSVITSSPYLPSVLRRLLCHCRTYVVTSSDLCVRFLLCASVVSFFVHALLLSFFVHALLLTFIAHATRKIDYKTTK